MKLPSKILIFIVLAFVFSCATTKHIPTNTNTYISYKDSLIIRYDTIFIEIPKQSYFNYTSFKDTLYLNTDIASSFAYIDFNEKILKGGISNKDSIKLKKEVIYKEKKIYRDTTIFKEIINEVPIEKEVKVVPNFYKFTSMYFVCSIIFLAIFIFLKFKL